MMASLETVSVARRFFDEECKNLMKLKKKFESVNKDEQEQVERQIALSQTKIEGLRRDLIGEEHNWQFGSPTKELKEAAEQELNPEKEIGSENEHSPYAVVRDARRNGGTSLH